jgi:hypothetical protein
MRPRPAQCATIRPSNGTSPRMADNSVVLPTPLGPMIACSVPRSIVREKLESST